ncbi:nephrocan-like [Drosophila kikkawai]|uniref:Nephrocan-like n=1 Tax=Drosophila kikkawai TaxID=30033 RepID=A0A6P4HWW1_DROKI|nr:leucine-rich repeat-containing protein 15-like [Drosophila kikkawai]
MITLYLLLTLAASVFGNGNYDAFCTSRGCWLQNDSEVKTLSISQSSDLDVLKFIPKLEHLDVSSCNSDFKMDVLPPMAELKRIWINKCHIAELKKKQFENLIQLNELDLAGNFIEKLSNESFHKLSSLQFLYLQNNSIVVLPEGVFNTLEKLTWLDLRNNKLSNLSKDIFQGITNLFVLYLGGNPLKTINLDIPLGKDILSSDINLKYSDHLRDMRLFARVSYLNLENSGLEKLEIRGSISNIIHKNSKVTHADFHGTEFGKSFPEVLCSMPSLEWLDLSNSDKTFSYSVFEFDKTRVTCDFPNLRFLNLSAIRIRSIPRRLPLFGHNLTTLDLSHNFLNDKSLEDIFDLDTYYHEEGNFPNLSFLNMSNNEVKHIPLKFPLFGPNLITLDLSHNLLEDVSLESLAEAQSLQSLYLEGNLLMSFEYLPVFYGLKNLKQLALFDNLFNATFYDAMTNYYDHTELHLIQKKKRIIEKEDQEKHENSNEKANQTLPRRQDDFNHVTPTTFGILSETEDQEKHENSNEKANQTLPRRQDDISHVTPTAICIPSETENHQPSENVHQTPSKEVNQNLKGAKDLTIPVSMLTVFIIMCVLMIVVLNINKC